MRKPYSEIILERDINDMRTLLETTWGRRIMWRIMKKCYINALPVVFGENDKTLFNIGMQNIGNILLTEVMAINPEAYLKMVKQGKKDEELIEKEMEDERRNSDN